MGNITHSYANKGKKLLTKQIELMKINNSKKYLIEYNDGNIVEISGLKKFGIDNNIPYVSLFKSSQHQTPLKKYNIKNITCLNTTQ